MIRGALVGTGGMGAAWASHLLPQVRDRIEIVGLADISPQARATAGEALGVPAERQFADYHDLFTHVPADLAILVLPPAIRVDAVRAASSAGLAILAEKPMASTWEDTLTIGEIVRESGIKFAVMQNYREQDRIRALKQVLARPEFAEVNLIETRFATNFTIETSGGAFRHQVPDALIFEGAEHHLDQLRNLTGVDAEWVSGAQWGQPWSTFGGPTCASLLIKMANDVMVQYEMNHVERGHQNGWHAEYYRVSTAGGTVTLDSDHTIRIVRDTPGGEVIETVTPEPGAPEGHIVVIGQFLDWLESGAPPVSVWEDNVRTMALTFGAIRATHTGERVDIPAMLRDAGIGEG